MLCGLVPPQFPLTALIDPRRLLAGGVVGLDESRRSNSDRGDWFPSSGNMVRDGWGVGEAVLAVLGSEFVWRSNDAGWEPYNVHYQSIISRVSPRGFLVASSIHVQ